jgi:hypothetical protein
MKRAKEQLRVAEEMSAKLEGGGKGAGNGEGRGAGRALLAGNKGGGGVKHARAAALLKVLDEQETFTCPAIQRKSENRVSWFGFKTNTVGGGLYKLGIQLDHSLNAPGFNSWSLWSEGIGAAHCIYASSISPTTKYRLSLSLSSIASCNWFLKVCGHKFKCVRLRHGARAEHEHVGG